MGGGISPLPTPHPCMHDKQIMAPALPLPCLQGWLTCTPTSRQGQLHFAPKTKGERLTRLSGMRWVLAGWLYLLILDFFLKTLWKIQLSYLENIFTGIFLWPKSVSIRIVAPVSALSLLDLFVFLLLSGVMLASGWQQRRYYLLAWKRG